MGYRLTSDEACCRRCASVEQMHRAATDLAMACGIGAALEVAYANVVAEGVPSRFEQLLARLGTSGFSDGPVA